MCGIFGVITKEDSKFSPALKQGWLDVLFKLSESRGKEAAGLAIKTVESIAVFKKPTAASEMIGSPEYKKIIQQYVTGNHSAIIGHSRLVTNGLQTLHNNNQPVIKDNLVGVHNGIIVNVDNLWQQFSDLARKYEVDTEVILSLIRKFIREKGSIIQAVQTTFGHLEGAASIAVLLADAPYLILTTNTGSLYTCLSKNKDAFVFASENYILKKFAEKSKETFDQEEVKHLPPGIGYLINLNDLKIEEFKLTELQISKMPIEPAKNLEIIDLSLPNGSPEKIDTITQQKSIKGIVQYEIPNLKRCTKCILPETFPGINFDEQGVCNLCRNHQKNQVKGEDALQIFTSKYKNNSGKPDCLVAFSGGRDSSYGLHYIKNILKMNPIAFTYDWGMVTDLARRNQARICAKLGIEHIIVSADIKKKRENIRKNIEAWLKKPDLGMVPLFMAGDKQFFYYANKLMKQNNLKLMVWCENEKLENTKFKTGFCGVYEGNNRWANMPGRQKIKLAFYYAKQFIKNPSYLNASLLDTLFAYLSTYLLSHDYLFLYRYIDWEEQKLTSTLINNYNWETAKDTKTTWRIGDGTAPFYNYIYYTVAGFSENDTFRSNQIREGLISREEALKFVKEENEPRPESLQWYADQLGLDLEKTIKIINSIPKRYKI
ncbi:MAG: hypothetical protein WC675_02110 [Patescibacteria group bacterium]|jgi:asparagine synthetase B (glutamine-hydrolysing)